MLSCTYQPGLCTCTGVVPYPDEKLTEPYSASGSDLTLAGEQATYCVSGKGLVIDFKVHPVSWRWWVARAALSARCIDGVASRWRPLLPSAALEEAAVAGREIRERLREVCDELDHAGPQDG